MANRRDLLKLAGLGATAFQLPASMGTLPNGTTTRDQAKLDRQPFGDLRVYYSGPTDQLKSMTAGSLLLKPGMSPHPPHQHPEEEFMVIAEGNGEITVEGKVTKVGPGSMMYCAANHVHGIVNTGKEPLLFYYYKWKA
ncbi:MAG: cupin domain-containing protein [Bryobacteraceae bacterium]